MGGKGRDFGRGFYTTTVIQQARAWAWQRCFDHNADLAPGASPATPEVVVFRVDREALAKLDFLVFVRGDFRWSLLEPGPLLSIKKARTWSKNNGNELA